MKRFMWLILIIILLNFIPQVFADGGFFPGTYYSSADISEPTQKAVIKFNNNQETLIIEATYEGDISDFAWVIPVPSYPVVTEGNHMLFIELAEVTAPTIIRAPSLFSGFGKKSLGHLDQFLNGVNLHEQKQVGIYEVSVLSVENADALLTWLNKNKYKISEKAKKTIDFYIKKKWYFIAKRINLNPFNEKLLKSLKDIDSEITTRQGATSLLTEDIFNAIKSKKRYENYPELKKHLDYGFTKEELDNAGLFYSKPTVLISSKKYTDFYESYNGFLPEHMNSYLFNIIKSNLKKQTRMPHDIQCYNANNRQGNYKYCDVWYFTKDSKEYSLLKNIDCGTYCLSDSQIRFSSEELAELAAYAIMNDNKDVINFFGVAKPEKDDWYDNYNDLFKNTKGILESKLSSKLRKTQVNPKHMEIEKKAINEYSQKLGINFNSLDAVAKELTKKVLKDINDAYDENSIYASVLTPKEFEHSKSLYFGNKDAVELRKEIMHHVEKIVNWREEQISNKLSSGEIQPIKIKFETDKIIYPLKISSVNKGEAEILLYVVADHKIKVEGFTTEYSDWFSPERDAQNNGEYGKLGYYYGVFNELNKLITKKSYITKLRNIISAEDMKDDLILVRAENDEVYRKSKLEELYFLKWVGNIIMLIMFVVFIYLLFIPCMLLNNKIFKLKKTSIFFLIGFI